MGFAFEVWLSLVERYVRDVEAASSNLVTSILGKRSSSGWPFFSEHNDFNHLFYCWFVYASFGLSYISGYRYGWFLLYESILCTQNGLFHF